MPLLATTTVLLLTLGALLALFGVLGFLGNWTSHPDHDSIRYLQTLATTGRRAITAGIALHLLAHGLPGGPALSLLLCAALLAGATYLTRTTNQILPAGVT